MIVGCVLGNIGGGDKDDIYNNPLFIIQQNMNCKPCNIVQSVIFYKKHDR